MTRILIVEDESIVAKDVQMCLRGLNYEAPVIAATGEEAVRQAEETRPDLVLMDIRLRGPMDGIEAAGTIRQRLHIPVVYLTAQTDEQTLKRAKVTGPFGYILKPFDDRDLHITIEMALATHQLEMRLRLSEERIRGIVENALDAVVGMDLDGVVTEWNPQAERTFGFSRDEALGRPLVELILPERYRQAHLRGLAGFRSTGRGRVIDQRLEMTALRKDGREFPVELAVTHARSGDSHLFSAFLRDITERKQAQQDLAASELKYRTLVETTNTGFLIKDEHGRVIDANSEYVRHTGHLTLSDIRGRSVLEWTAEHDRRRNADEIRHCLERGFTRSFEIDYIDRRGRITPVEINATVLTTEAGPQIISLCRDISERRRAAEALALKAAELQRSNADLDEFAYVASHDLKGPLGMVIRHAQRLERRCGDGLDPESRDHIESIKTGVRLMDRLIQDLYSNSQVGRDKRVESVDCRRLLDQVREVLQPMIEDAGATLRSGDLPTVVGNRTDLLQVFQNLIQNAIKFRSEQRPPEVCVRCERQDDFWVFQVTDNGIGIEPAYRARIFQIFERLPTARQTEGTGIGLANCKKAIERRGGRIWVESAPDHGSTFFFTLPAPAPVT